MAYVNFKNSPSEETPLTGGATGNLNVMQENGTSHGADTKLGYTQSFLNEHIINVSNEVDEEYRTNIVKGKNLCNLVDSSRFTYRYKGTTSPYYQTFIPIEILSNKIKVRPNGGNYTEGYIDIKGLKPNTKYSISYTILENTTNFNPTITISNSGVTDANGNITLNLLLNNGGTSGSTSTYVVYGNIQLEEGNTPTTFEEYISPNIVVDNEEIYNKEKEEIFSLGERRIGYWLDGKPLYRKVIDFGALPNNTEKSVAHNISNIDTITRIEAMAKNTTNLAQFHIPLSSTVSLASNIYIFANSINVTIGAGADRSALNQCYVILEYTKTTSTRNIETPQEETR